MSSRTAPTASPASPRCRYPAWDLVALDGYALPLVNKRYVIVETSRGCPYTCDFCVAPIHQGHKFRERRAEIAGRRDRVQARELGVDFFYLWGDTVTLNVKSFGAFCDELIARKLPIHWFGNARADNLTDPAFVHATEAARAAGCSRSGIESESDEVRKDMVKRLERQKIQAAFQNMREAGIKSFAFFIFGYPGETPETMDQTSSTRSGSIRTSRTSIRLSRIRGPRFTRSAMREGLLPGERGLVEDGVFVLPAARERPRRSGRHAGHQPREAPLLPASGLHGAARRRRRADCRDEAEHCVAGPVAHALWLKVVDTFAGSASRIQPRDNLFVFLSPSALLEVISARSAHARTQDEAIPTVLNEFFPVLRSFSGPTGMWAR